MERLRAEIRALEGQIEALDEASVDWLSAQDAATAYQRAGRDGVWDMWRVGRTRELGMRIAQLRADLERQSLATRRSVGRHQAIAKLVERHGPGPGRRGD